MARQKFLAGIMVSAIIFILLLGCLQPAEIYKTYGDNDNINKLNPLPKNPAQNEPQTTDKFEKEPQPASTKTAESTQAIQMEFNPKSSGKPNPKSIQPHPEQCCNHPYYHYIVSASSSNGLNWQEDSADAVTRDHASVPDYEILEDGTHMLYFVDGIYDTLGCMESTDGKTFSDYDCRIYNFTKEKIWDPNVVSIGNGTYRLFFFSPEFEPSMGQPNRFDQPKNRIYSAISKNGKDWLMESGVRYEDISITDPAVIKRADGVWFMFVSHGNTIIEAKSNDGLTFKKIQEINTIGGVPDVVEMDSRYYLFTCSNGISYSVSDDLMEWSGLKNAIKPWGGGVICDPTVEKTDEGYRMYLKRMGMPNQK